MLASRKALILPALLAALVAALVPALDSTAAPTCTISWDRGAATTSWHDAANWSTDTLPGPSDHVCLPDVAASTEVVFSTGSATVASIQAPPGSEPLRLGGGTLAIGGAPGAETSQVDRLVQTGGSLTGSAVVNVDTFVWRGGEQTTPPTGPNGNLVGTGVTHVTRSLSMEDSSPTWAPNTSNDAKDLRRELRIAAGATAELKGRNTGLQGRLNISGLSAKLVNHGVLTIRDDQDVTSNVCCPNPAGPGALLSDGTIVKAAGVDANSGEPTGAGESVLDAPMDLDGVVESATGTLRVDGTGLGVHAADFRVAGGAGLRFNGGTHTVDSPQGVHRQGTTGTARVSFTGGSTTIAAPFSVQETAFSAGTARFDETTSPGPLTLSGGRADFNGATTVSTLTQTGGSLGGTAALTFSAVTWRGGEQDTPPSGPNGNLVGTGVTHVTGTLTIEDSSPTWNPQVNNDTKDLRRELRIAPGATGVLRGRNGTGSTGRLNLSGLSARLTNQGTFTIRDDLDIVTNVCCPNPGGLGAFVNTGTLVKAAGTDLNTGQPTDGGETALDALLDLDGVVDVDAGTLRIDRDGVNTHAADFRVSPGTALRWNGGTHTVASSQGVHRDGTTGAAGARFSGGTVTFDAPFSAQETRFDGGTARFNGTTAPGPLTLASGRADLNGPATVSTLTQTGGSLGGSAPLSFASVTWRGGEQDTPPTGPNNELPGTGVTEVTGTLTMEDSSPTWSPQVNNDSKDLRRELRIAPGATATLGGRNGTGSTGRLNLSGFSAKLTNQGTFTIKDDQDLASNVCCPNPGGPGLVVNTGTIRKAPGTDPTDGSATGGGVSVLAPPMDLDGVVDVAKGTLQLAGTGTNTHAADFRVAGATTLQWAGGTHTLESPQGIHRQGATGTATTAFSGGAVTIDAPYAMQETRFDGGTARFNGATSPGPLTLAAGRADFNGATSVSTLLQTGGSLGGSAPLSFTTMTWRGGEQDTPRSGPHGDQPGTGTTEVTGTLSIEDSSPTWSPTVANDQKDLRRELIVPAGATAVLKGRNGADAAGRLNLSGFSAKLTNRGTFTIRDDQDILSGGCCVSPGGRGLIVNTGTIVKAAGTAPDTGEPTGAGQTFIGPPLDQQGTVSADAGRLRLDEPVQYDLQTDTLGGGTYRVRSTLALAQGPLSRLTGTLVLDGAAARVDDAGTQAADDGLASFAGVEPGGRLTVSGGAAPSVPNLANKGTVAVGGASTLTVTGGLQNTGTLQGTGTVAAAVTNGGVVEPGGSPGTLTVSGAFTQTAAGTLRTEIETAGADRLAVSGTATLGGTLDLPGTATPAQGATFRLVDCGTCAGTFATVTGAVIDADRSYGLLYDPAHVDAIVARRAEPAISLPATATVAEGDAATKTLTVDASLAFPTDRTVRVDWAAGGGSATKPDDYTAAGGTLTFGPGETKRPIEVVVKGDALDEPDETLELTLSKPVSATIAPGAGKTVATITDDDETPTVVIGADQLVEEPDAGDADAQVALPVRLSAPSGRDVRVAFATSDGTAKQPGDYEASSGFVDFARGETAKTVLVDVKGDDADEPRETFGVKLSSPTAAVLGARSAAEVGIVDNDAPAPVGTTPQVAVDDVAVGEGDGATTDARFVVSLSTATTHPVTVDYATANGTAKAPGDYAARAGRLTFGPGETQRAVSVPVAGDDEDEETERFTLALSAPQGATAGTMTGTATVADDDDPPKVETRVETKVETRTQRVEVPVPAPPVQTLVARSVDPQYVGCVQRSTPFSYRFVFPLTRTDDRGRRIQRKARVVRVTVMFEGRPIGRLTKSPFTARLDLSRVEAGLHELVANAVLQAPKSKRTSTKQFRYLFQVCP